MGKKAQGQKADSWDPPLAVSDKKPFAQQLVSRSDSSQTQPSPHGLEERIGG
jgi:hypothetical protein